MTEKEAIQQLEFDREMILFDPTTGENMTLEVVKALNKDNYFTYLADGIAILALKEIQQYREIGTVEECREAVEKQKAKKPFRGRVINGNEYEICRKCTAIVKDEEWKAKYCPVCGQAIDWSEEE